MNYDDDVPVSYTDPVTHLADHVIAEDQYTDQYGTCHSALGDDPNCDLFANKWTTLIRFPAGNRKGRFRINVRTVTNELVSYGQNSFALHAFYLNSGTNEASAPVGGDWAPCTTLTGQPVGYAQFCPNIAGDTSMATNASATSAGPADFYLAKLSPASQYRGKIIQVLLWDPGEGGEAVQILGPKKLADGSAYDATTYDPVEFKWKLNNPGINSLSDRTSVNGPAQPEPQYAGCGVGTNKASYTWNAGYAGATVLETKKFLDISGGPVETDGSGNSCLPFDPANRGGTGNASAPYHPSSDPTGRFNGRLVNLEIQVPATYGLNDAGQEIPLSFDGWWKIKYFPIAVGGVITPVTDRSTWTVQLIGDPVHLVRG